MSPAPRIADSEIGANELWKEPPKDILAHLTVTSSGLSSKEATSRLTTYGANGAVTVKRLPLWLRFLARFRNPLVIILLIASALSAATGDLASFFNRGGITAELWSKYTISARTLDTW
jgi:Mg2+-importing ATPase